MNNSLDVYADARQLAEQHAGLFQRCRMSKFDSLQTAFLALEELRAAEKKAGTACRPIDFFVRKACRDFGHLGDVQEVNLEGEAWAAISAQEADDLQCWRTGDLPEKTPAKVRDLLVLVEGGKPFAEAAQAAGISTTALKLRVRRAIEKLEAGHEGRAA